jgi:hypothetical protein
VRYRWSYRNTKILAAFGVVAVVVIATWLLVWSDRAGPKGAIGTPSRSSPLHVAPRPSAPRRFQRPGVAPASTSQQSLIDSELRQAEQHSPLPAGALASLPDAGRSPGYPAVPVADRSDPITFGLAFVTELLDRDYGRQFRQGLLAWAQAESAPNTLPGVPADLANRALVLSLINPAPAAGPVSSAAEWTGDARSGRAETVKNVQAAVNAQWLALTASGWQPADPSMTILTVTGTLVVHEPAGISTESFSLDLTLGSSESRPGYGAVAVDDWSVM